MDIQEQIADLRELANMQDTRGEHERLFSHVATLEALNKVYVAADAYFNCKGMFPPERPVIDAIAEVKAIQEGK